MVNCPNCGIETQNPKYCSRSCAAQQTNRLYPKKKSKKICTQCTNLAVKPTYRLCEHHKKIHRETMHDHIKEQTLQCYWDRRCLVNLHSSSKNAHIRGLARSWFRHLTKMPCANCGYDKHVELCHIISISKFPPTAKLKEVNSPQNIIQLCPNCHWEFDNGNLRLDSPTLIEYS